MSTFEHISHQNLKCHPSTVNRTHSLLTRSSGKGSYRGCPSPPLRHRRRKEGSRTNYRFGRVRGRVYVGICGSHSVEPGGTYSMYIMTPMAQQSTGRPYRCLPTTSGAEGKTQLQLTVCVFLTGVHRHIYRDTLGSHRGPWWVRFQVLPAGSRWWRFWSASGD